MQLCGYTVKTFVSDLFRLDGGSMFGSVPKALWQKQIMPDDLNRIQLACRLVLLESDDRKILIDCGMGQKWEEKERGIYQIQPVRELPKGVTDLVLTHLHFDHAGGISTRNEKGELVPTYPDATIYLQKANYDRALHPGPRERASYLTDNTSPLSGARLHLCADGEEILPGITVHRSDGHTCGLQWIVIGDKLAYPSDLIPTSHHVPVPYVMGYDLHAEKTIEEKERFLELAVQKQWTVIFEHDAEIGAARIEKDAHGRFKRGEIVILPEL